MVKRLTMSSHPLEGAAMDEHPHGDYVSYSDYAKLEAQLAELEAENDGLQDAVAHLRGRVEQLHNEALSRTGAVKVDAAYLRETLAWVRRNMDEQPSQAKQQIDLALGSILSALDTHSDYEALEARCRELEEALQKEKSLSDRLASALEYIDDYCLSYPDLGTISAVAQPALKAHSDAASVRMQRDTAQSHKLQSVLHIPGVKEILALPEGQQDPVPAGQHVAYYDDGQFHWMSGIAPRNCELYALEATPPSPKVTEECDRLRADLAKARKALEQAEQQLNYGQVDAAHRIIIRAARRVREGGKADG